MAIHAYAAGMNGCELARKALRLSRALYCSMEDLMER